VVSSVGCSGYVYLGGAIAHSPLASRFGFFAVSCCASLGRPIPGALPAASALRSPSRPCLRLRGDAWAAGPRSASLPVGTAVLACSASILWRSPVQAWRSGKVFHCDCAVPSPKANLIGLRRRPLRPPPRSSREQTATHGASHCYEVSAHACVPQLAHDASLSQELALAPGHDLSRP
jgi:hypothetical protein